MDEKEKNNPSNVRGEVKEWRQDNTVYVEQDVPTIYCNNVKMSLTNWDVSLLFGEMLDEKKGKLQVMPRVKITMSLQYAKAFRFMLDSNIKNFEEQVGEIQEFRPKEPGSEKPMPFLGTASKKNK